MTQFKRVILGLDFSPLDQTILEYLAQIHKAYPIETLYALHIVPGFSAPRIPEGDFIARFIQDQPLDEVLAEKISQQVKAIFGEQPPFAIKINQRRQWYRGPQGSQAGYLSGAFCQ